MPVDPFTALSVAAAVIQFVDFSVSIVSKGRHLYKSPTGSLAEHDEAWITADRLHSMANVLTTSMKAEFAFGEDEALTTICIECVDIAEQLQFELSKLKVAKGPHNRPWKSFRQALKSVWSKEKVEAMKSRLAQLKADLSANVLVSIRYL